MDSSKPAPQPNSPESSKVQRDLWRTLNLSTRTPTYLFQSGMATVSLIVILLVEDVVLRAAIVVAVASSAFTIFIVPNSIASSPRRVIGGHGVAVVAGAIFSSVLFIPIVASAAETSRLPVDLMAALSVGVGMLAMAVTNTEHPPAAGTALGLVIVDWSWSAVLFIMSSAVILSLIHMILRRRLINLL